MDATSKQTGYNNSDYAARLAEKKALYDASTYGQKQALSSAATSPNKITKPTQYTLPNGKVLMRYPSANRINFKSLFGSIGSDDSTTNATDTLSLMKNMKASSDAWMDAYTKISKQNLGLG